MISTQRNTIQRMITIQNGSEHERSGDMYGNYETVTDQTYFH